MLAWRVLVIIDHSRLAKAGGDARRHIVARRPRGREPRRALRPFRVIFHGLRSRRWWWRWLLFTPTRRFLVIGPGGFLPPLPEMMPPFLAGTGVASPFRPFQEVSPPARRANVRPANFRHGDPVRAGQLITLGDRLFRAGNLKKAEERFQQASRTAPNWPLRECDWPQVALARGNSTEAAARLREAETAEPGWIVTAPDIQSLFGEPAEFSRSLARLESHLQVHPDDRDAWLVFGSQWFLSGRTDKAADVFKRLNDPKREPNIALAAFLDASNQAEENPAKPPQPAPDPIQ